MTTHLLTPGALICVPESQRLAYENRLERDLPKLANKTAFAGAARPRILAHPNNIIGKPAKLNWVFDHLPDRDIAFLDDDLESVILAWVERGELTKSKDPAHVLALIQHTMNLAREMGIYFVGWGKAGNPSLYYSGLEPFSLSGFINGTSFGFLSGHGLRFDARLTAKADYDMSLQNALKHRRCLRDNRYCFESRKTFRNPGGMSLMRNSLTEKRDLEILRKKWGAAIGIPRGGNSRSDGRGYAGVTRLELKLPF